MVKQGRASINNHGLQQRWIDPEFSLELQAASPENQYNLMHMSKLSRRNSMKGNSHNFTNFVFCFFTLFYLKTLDSGALVVSSCY